MEKSNSKKNIIIALGAFGIATLANIVANKIQKKDYKSAGYLSAVGILVMIGLHTTFKKDLI